MKTVFLITAIWMLLAIVVWFFTYAATAWKSNNPEIREFEDKEQLMAIAEMQRK